MFRLIISIIFFGGAIVLFLQVTQPTFAKIDALRAEESRLDVALTKANELRAERANLQSRFNLFSDDDKARLLKLLPDTVDNVRFIIDIDRISASHDLQLANLTIESGGAVEEGRTKTLYGSAVIGFSVNASYQTFLEFVADLERSLRLVDVLDVAFTSGNDGDLNSYQLKVRTYWLPTLGVPGGEDNNQSAAGAGSTPDAANSG